MVVDFEEGDGDIYYEFGNLLSFASSNLLRFTVLVQILVFLSEFYTTSASHVSIRSCQQAMSAFDD